MSDPLKLFCNSWESAKTSGDPSAHFCTLATVSDSGQVSMRTLVLREVVNGRFTVFTNATSPKWRDLNQASAFELLIFWPSLMQQYRIRGELHRVPLESMKTHWAHKPYAAKILDLYYARVAAQSSVLASRDSLLEGIAQLKKQFPLASDIHFPEQVSGVAIEARYIERWQGSDADRLHQRTLYLRDETGEQWQEKILVP